MTPRVRDYTGLSGRSCQPLELLPPKRHPNTARLGGCRSPLARQRSHSRLGGARQRNWAASCASASPIGSNRIRHKSPAWRRCSAASMTKSPISIACMVHTHPTMHRGRLTAKPVGTMSVDKWRTAAIEARVRNVAQLGSASGLARPGRQAGQCCIAIARRSTKPTTSIEGASHAPALLPPS